MKNQSKKIKLIVPFLILFILFGLLWRELFYFKHNELPSALIGKTMPEFQLPDLSSPYKTFSQKELTGRVSLLNVWASWCYACAFEQPMLMKISEEYHIPVYGIVYKDDPVAATEWLEKYGNPYVMIGQDKNGDVAIDLGVYGTPETFLISAQGEILYRHVGVLDQKNWDEVLYPLVKHYNSFTQVEKSS